MGLLGSIGHAFGDVGKGIGSAAKSVADGVGHAAADAWHGAEQAASTAADTAGKVVHDVADGAGRAVHDVGDGVAHGDVLGGLSRAEQNVAHGAGQGLSDGWHGATDAVGQAAAGLNRSEVDLGKGVSQAYDRATDGVAGAVGDVAGPGAGQAVHDAAQTAAAPVRQAAQFAHGVQEGVAEGAGSLVRGVGDLGVGAVRLSTDSAFRGQVMDKAGEALDAAGHAAADAIHDPGAAFHRVQNLVGDTAAAVVQSGQQAAHDGNLAEWAGKGLGRAGFEVAATVGLPEVRAAEIAGDAGRVVEAAGTAERAVEGVTSGGRALDAVRTTDRAVEGASDAAQQAGRAEGATRPLALPPGPPPPTPLQQAQALTGHGHVRHGSETTMAEQTTRVQTGMAPDHVRAPTNRATRFDGPEAELDAVSRAQARAADREAGGTLRTAIEVDRNGVARLPRDSSVVTGFPGGYGSGVELPRDAATGRYLRTAPPVPTGQDANALVVLERQPATGKWQPVTQYPTNKPVTP